MGFFSSLFHRKSKKERELDDVLAKINRLFNDDKLQTELLPDMFKAKMNPVPMDTLPEATGEFGRDPKNPIPCNGPLGEITYLSRLVIPTFRDPERITFHRLWSQDVGPAILDTYEIVSYDGHFHDILYLDMYHTHKSKLCPRGYQLEEECKVLRGMNVLNETFPYNQYQKVRDCVRDIIGLALVDTSLKTLDEKQAEQTIKAYRKNSRGQ